MKYPIQIPTKGKTSSIEIPLAVNGNRGGFQFGIDGGDCLCNQRSGFRFSGCSSEVIKVSDHDRHVMSSSPVPTKTRRVGQRCTLNLLRAETSCRCVEVNNDRTGCPRSATTKIAKISNTNGYPLTSVTRLLINTATLKYYITSRTNLREKKPELWRYGWLLHQDNASASIALSTKQFPTRKSLL
ncbi:hypothetical protein TNCV_2597011 [Trichonephila clavipes]|nr:hypothetical protein TNCV_2597011 [Trichonephila clavipes]